MQRKKESERQGFQSRVTLSNLAALQLTLLYPAVHQYHLTLQLPAVSDPELTSLILRVSLPSLHIVNFRNVGFTFSDLYNSECINLVDENHFPDSHIKETMFPDVVQFIWPVTLRQNSKVTPLHSVKTTPKRLYCTA